MREVHLYRGHEHYVVEEKERKEESGDKLNDNPRTKKKRKRN